MPASWRRLRDLLPPPVRVRGTGVAATSLDRSLGWALLLPTAAGHILITLVLLGTLSATPPILTLVIANVAAGALAAATARSRTLGAWPTLLVTHGLAIGNYWAAPTVGAVLTLSTSWLVDLANVSVALLLRGRAGIACGLLVPVTQAGFLTLTHPAWFNQLAVAVTVTGWSTLVAVRLARRSMDGFAAQADEEQRRAAEQRTRVEVARAAGQDAAETARVLHDTVINTLVAISNGGRAIADRAGVRQRCASDVATVQGLLEGERAAGDAPGLPVAEYCRRVGLGLRRTGLTDAQTAELFDTLPAAVGAAIAGAAQEAIQNTAKHAEVDSVTVDVRSAGGVTTVQISDSGVGFDPAAGFGHGLTQSVLQRCHDSGVQASVDSAPGFGTQVTVTYTADEPAADPEHDFADVVETTQRAACWVFVAGVVAVGFSIAPTIGSFTWTFGMLAAIVVLAIPCWLLTRDGAELGPVARWVVVAAAPLLFVLSFAGVDFGRDHSQLWQLLGPAVPPMILLYACRSRVPFVASGVAMLLASAVLTVLPPGGAEHRTLAAAGGMIDLLAYAALFVFHSALATVGATGAASSADAVRSRIRLAARQAADASRLRWRAAGLSGAVDLLSRIADGRADPTAAQVRADCAREERHLRQLILLSPEAINTGFWFARALADAHDRDVELTTRVGDCDIDDEQASALLGEAVLSVVRRVPTGSAVTVALLPTRDGLSLTVVGPQQALEDGPRPLPDGAWRVSSERFGERGLVEWTWQGATAQLV